MTDDALLTVHNLQVRFQTERGEQTAVQDLSFRLQKGDTLAIVGESGSGKSVSLLSILRLLPQDTARMQGSIVFGSKSYGQIDLMSLSREKLHHLRGNEISMIFQEPMSSLNPVYTCGEQVMEVILRHDEKSSRRSAKNRVLGLFEKVRFSNPERIFKSFPHELSGGQKQRVMIAMALACKPLLLIADEPTTALDVTVQATILDILKSLRQDENMSIIFITHDLGVVAEIADRVLVLYQGKAVEENGVFELFNNPQHAYTKGLLACRPRLDVRLKVLPTVSDFMRTDETGNIAELAEVKFKDVGQAIMFNYQTESEIIKKRERLYLKNPILSIKNLSKHYEEQEGGFFWKRSKTFKKAVDDLSFDVYQGETLAIVGESGCGKTTLGRTILRLIEPTAGDIIFEGRKIHELSQKELRMVRKDMQIIFQDPYSSLNPRLTIGEIISEPMRIYQIGASERARRERVMEILNLVNLNPAHYHRYPHEFSGGQRQRIAIARSLALEPKFIICDESVSALDVSVQAQVLNLLNALKEQFGLTYIFISHDLSVVRFIADRIMVMQDGKIVELDFPENIYDKAQNEYTQTLINAIPKSDIESVRKHMIQRKLQRKEQPD
ncbi:ABC transporter ATP-binding protein [Hugenholtzia roseola]|uniref:ABC transporter ATP-binding protein n=1 Tax=Hugenholtzia roseola TaxID=1002 RepID=UPI00040EDF79|nr:ABC transporter ATP-binding protein [Hugenholtzia roseola]